jgi:hypothetical protein
MDTKRPINLAAYYAALRLSVRGLSKKSAAPRATRSGVIGQIHERVRRARWEPQS